MPVLRTPNTTSPLDLIGTPATSIVSVKPIALTVPGRGHALHVRVSAPVTGQEPPILLFSHGYGSSLDGYGPLTDYWAAHGFLVVQPTHLDSRTLGLPADDPRTPRIWRHRVEDLIHILDRIDELAAALPGPARRPDHGRIAVAGHSFGGQSAGNLLGLRIRDPETGEAPDLSDSRVRAGVLLATAGRGGADLSPFAAEHFPFMNPDFTAMTAPALIVAGDRDDSPLTTRGPDWLTDPYHLSPGRKSLLTLLGAEHSLGGIPGYEAAETTDEDPARVALLRQVGLAYLRHVLDIDDTGWERTRRWFARTPSARARLTSRGPE